MNSDFSHKISEYKELANRYYQFARLMRHNNQNKTALILCSLALSYTSRALYIYHNKSNLTPCDPIITNSISLTHKALNIDPRVTNLVDIIDLLCYSKDNYPIDQENVDYFLRETKEILLSVNIMVITDLRAP